MYYSFKLWVYYYYIFQPYFHDFYVYSIKTSRRSSGIRLLLSPLPFSNFLLNNTLALRSSLIYKELLELVEDVVHKYVKLRGKSNAG